MGSINTQAELIERVTELLKEITGGSAEKPAAVRAEAEQLDPLLARLHRQVTALSKVEAATREADEAWLIRTRRQAASNVLKRRYLDRVRAYAHATLPETASADYRASPYRDIEREFEIDAVRGAFWRTPSPDSDHLSSWWMSGLTEWFRRGGSRQTRPPA